MGPPRDGLEVFTHENVVLWAGGNRRAPLDVWFHPAFGDNASTYRNAFESKLAWQARILVYDPPGHGASPPRKGRLSLADCVRLWVDLVRRYSGSRPVALVGHSMAGVIASLAANRLLKPPILVIGVEANLTCSDAYLTGLATQFDDPAEFHRSLLVKIQRRGQQDEVFRRFCANLRSADSRTLWSLGRSAYARQEPGTAFRRLRCPGIYYWDATHTSRSTQAYVERHRLPNRRLDRLGHWPMISAPDVFYSAVAQDILRNARTVAGHG